MNKIRINNKSPIIWYLSVLVILLSFLSLLITPQKLSAVQAVSLLLKPSELIALPRLIICIFAAVMLGISGSVLQGLLGSRKQTFTYISFIVLAAFAATLVALIFSIKILGLSPDPYAWLLGGFSAASWIKVMFMLPCAALAVFAAIFFYKDLNALLMGEDLASTLGVNVVPTRYILTLISIIFAACGLFLLGISSITLLISPFIIKYIAGTNYKNLFPLAALFVISIVLISDILARVILPTEIPVGIILILLGLPIMMYLYLTRRAI